MDFTVAAEQNGSSWSVRVRGEVDMATSPQLEAELDKAVATKPDHVLVDLADVTFLDSSGIRALLVARRRLSDADASLSVSAMSDSVKRVLEIAGVLEVLSPDAA